MFTLSSSSRSERLRRVATRLACLNPGIGTCSFEQVISLLITAKEYEAATELLFEFPAEMEFGNLDPAGYECFCQLREGKDSELLSLIAKRCEVLIDHTCAGVRHFQIGPYRFLVAHEVPVVESVPAPSIPA